MDKPLFCQHCDLGISERPAWHRGSMFQWMHIGTGLIRCEGKELKAQPQPDSSSISTEQTFEEWLQAATAVSCYQEQLIKSADPRMLRLLKECWNTAKGQSNGR